MLRSREWILAWTVLIGSTTVVESCSSGSNAGSPGPDSGADAANVDGNGLYDSGYVNQDDSGGGGGGGAGGGIGGVDAAPVPCNVSVQGLTISTGFTCTTTTEYFSSVKRTTFAISVADPRPLQLVSITLQEPGYPVTGTWSGTDPGASGGITVQEVPDKGPAPTWQCLATGAAPTEDGGAPDAGAPDGAEEGGAPEGGAPDGGAPDAGTVSCYTLDLTVGQGIVTSTGETFGSTGSLVANLSPEPQTGATGTVTVHVTF